MNYTEEIENDEKHQTLGFQEGSTKPTKDSSYLDTVR